MSRAEARDSCGFAELPHVAWRISSRSSSGSGNCVEAGPVTDGSGRVAARHSRHPHGRALVYTRDEWTAFLTATKHGTFDFST